MTGVARMCRFARAPEVEAVKIHMNGYTSGLIGNQRVPDGAPFRGLNQPLGRNGATWDEASLCGEEHAPLAGGIKRGVCRAVINGQSNPSQPSRTSMLK